MANTSFPDSAVVYLLDDIPGQGEFQATGVIIGPHTILTAAHFVYDADTGATADAISLYPGFTPDTTTYNPVGALGGSQTIHGIKVNDRGGELSAGASQADFAIIDTTADLSAYGSFALDPKFTSGDVVVKGYPASNGGNLTGIEGVVSQDGTLSDLDTTALPLSPGYSGGPIYDTVQRNGQSVPAVVGTVSTADDAMKLTRAKVALIRRWITSDRSFLTGEQDASKTLVPQISGTVSSRVDAAALSAPSGSSALSAAVDAATTPAFTYAEQGGGHASHQGWAEHHGGAARHGADGAAVPSQFADLVNALQGTAGGDVGSVAPASTEAGVSLAAPAHHRHHARVSGA